MLCLNECVPSRVSEWRKRLDGAEDDNLTDPYLIGTVTWPPANAKWILRRSTTISSGKTADDGLQNRAKRNCKSRYSTDLDPSFSPLLRIAPLSSFLPTSQFHRHSLIHSFSLWPPLHPTEIWPRVGSIPSSMSSHTVQRIYPCHHPTRRVADFKIHTYVHIYM